MFTPDALLKMGDGHTEPLSHLAQLGSSGSFSVATRPAPTSTTESVSFQTSRTEYVELARVGSSAPIIKCSPKAKLLLPGGGYVYAEESNGIPVETENGTATFAPLNRGTGELVTIRLASVHAACINGVWFLTE